MDRRNEEESLASAEFAAQSFYDWGRLALYERVTGPAERVKQRELAVMNEVLRQRIDRGLRCENMIDVGTCTGRYLRWAYDRGFIRLCGIDHSADAIVYCRMNLPFSCDLRV